MTFRKKIVCSLLLSLCIIFSIQINAYSEPTGFAGIGSDNSNKTLSGWACLPGNEHSINASIFIAKPRESGGHPFASVPAENESEDAVSRACNCGGRHFRFEIPITRQMQQRFGGRPVYFYGVANRQITALNKVGSQILPAVNGMLDRVDLNYIHGWAFPDASGAPTRVWFFTKDQNGSEVLLNPTSKENGRFAQNPATARFDLGSISETEPGYRPGCDFRLVTPEELKDGQNHAIFAYSVDHPDREFMLSGSPQIFNSHVLYRQESVSNLVNHVRITYSKKALSKRRGLRNTDSSSDKLSSVGQTSAAYWSMPTNPIAQPLNFSLKDITGLDVPQSSFSQQRGVNGNRNGIQALQVYGTAFGVSLAPRAISREGIDYGCFVGSDWPIRSNVRPFQGQSKMLKMSGFFRHPYTEVAPVGKRDIGSEGVVFYYYTLQFADKEHPKRDSKGSFKFDTIWFCVRLYQDKFARPQDKWDQLKNKEGLAVDASNPENKFGVIDTILRPSSSRISVERGSSVFSLKPFAGERKFSFSLSAAQLRNSIEQLNASHLLPQHFSTEPSDYCLIDYNIDIEAWAPGSSNPRVGLSFRDILIETSESN